jgi:hypothetical protein
MSLEIETPTIFFNNEYNSLKNKKNEDIDIYLFYFCNITNKNLILDYRFFKLIGNPNNYDFFLNILMNKIEKLLSYTTIFNLYFNIDTITLTELDKYSTFFIKVAKLFSEKYPDCLNKFYILGSGFMFDNMKNLFSLILPKKTRDKIEFMSL